MAKTLFKKSYDEDDTLGSYIYLQKWDKENLDLLFRLTQKENCHALNLLGNKIGMNKIDLNKYKDQLAFLFYCLAAEKGSSAGMCKIGLFWKNGIRIKQNIDKAAYFYEKALKNGYYKAKKLLDNIYDQTKTFKRCHKNYQKFVGSYKDFKKKEIILL